MQAKAQVIPFEEEWITKQEAARSHARTRPIPPEGAEVIPFRPKGGELPLVSRKAAPEAAKPFWKGAILHEESGQGTTEYAILVGVLVVIAIMAILIFRDKVQELWNAIADGINSL